MTLFDSPAFEGHEGVHAFSDEKTGLKAIIAVHSTARGPAAGGCRMWPYASAEDALTDALKLSRAMSYKNAMADLELGGGKSVIIGDSRTQWNGTPLPLDLTPFISAGGCYLQASPLFNLFAVTVGSPGNGLGSIAIPLPPVTGYIGQSFYSQWFVDDPAAVNFTMSSTGGIWSIVKAVGS